jgi:GH15 family glucan-1,4-alpha-glucosidase
MGGAAVAGMIEDYALIGDMHTAALICRDGSVDWLCLPRIDSGACFAALLGSEHNGHWRLAPAGAPAAGTRGSSAGPAARRRYQGDSLILETEWQTATGTVRVTDFMPPRDGEAPALVRIVEGVHGSVDMELTLRVRPDYGQIMPWMRKLNHDLVATAGPDSIWLSTPVGLTGRNFAHHGAFTVEAGQRVPFALTWGPSHLSRPQHLDAGRELTRTERFWEQWVSRCTYQGEYRDAVVRSLITLKALTYQPTGGIVAAPTTSLPEDLGGVRNWDYRFCWLRDATITLEALLRTGYTDEAEAWRGWLDRAVAGDPKDVQIMYSVTGERRLTEWEADWLPGYEGSSPVRVGNAAMGQLQLDVFGEVVDAMYLAWQAGIKPERHAVSVQRAMLDYLEKIWDQPDEGLWEVRGARQHFVHSKVMAWVAFDRAARAARTGLIPGPFERWERLAGRIHDEVCQKGFDSGAGAFTQAYGSTALDAAVLRISEVGFLPPRDPRMLSTIDAIMKRLMPGGFVRRYEIPESTGSQVDGLPGSEGAFLACSFWLANTLVMAERRDEAAEVFERLLSVRNDVGLLAEEFDPRYGRLVGNMPQAFSHVPLVQVALNLEQPHHLSRRNMPAPA